LSSGGRASRDNIADNDMMETTQSRLTCNEVFGGGAPARYWTALPRHQ